MYYTVSELVEKKIIEECYAKHMLEKCACGGTLIRNERLTSTKCNNPWCYVHMKYKADNMLKYLGVKGIGPETCEKLIFQYSIMHHLDLVPKIFDYKPRLHLWEVAKICQIEDYNEKCLEIFSGFKDFEEFFSQAPLYIPNDIRPYKDILIRAEKYFTINPPLSKENIEVMITGNLRLYSPRKLFIDKLNYTYGKFIRTDLKGEAQKNKYLITENPNSGHGKIATARKSSVCQVVTPDNYESIVRYKSALKIVSSLCTEIPFEVTDDLYADILKNVMEHLSKKFRDNEPIDDLEEFENIVVGIVEEKINTGKLHIQLETDNKINEEVPVNEDTRIGS